MIKKFEERSQNERKFQSKIGAHNITGGDKVEVYRLQKETG